MRMSNKLWMVLGWCGAAVISMLVTLLTCLPAAWLAPAVTTWSGGRVALGEIEGSVWRGSAVLAVTDGASRILTPLLPGRVDWQLSPWLLLGQLDLRLSDPEILAQPLHVSGSWHNWKVGQSALTMPVDYLTALGAPLNTIQPSGNLVLRWGALQLTRNNAGVDISGHMTLELMALSSRLSDVKPLGNYKIDWNWHQQRADIALTTSSGALLLQGDGRWNQGRMQFSGQAQAAPGQEERLANFLNLLGQPRQQGDGKTVVELQMKS